MERRAYKNSVRAAGAAASAIVILGLVAACGGQPPGSGDRLSVATGGSGGVYSVYGGGLANQITQNLEGREATAETTSASVDNMLLIDEESSDIAFTLADAAVDGVNGEGEFDEPVPARVLAQIYESPVQTVTTEGSGIDDIEDLEGKTVSLGDPNSSTEVLSLRILEAAGIDPEEDIEARNLGVSESVDALSDGSVDAFFWGGGLPTGAVTDAATTQDIKLLSSAEYLGELDQEYEQVYTESTIPAGTYPGVDQDVQTVGARNFLVVNESMDEELAHDITQLLFEQKDALVEVHPEAENLNLEDAQNVAPMELHPGAQRYYDEEG